MSVIEEKKALRTYIRQTERTLDPAYKAESSEAICRCVLALEEYRAAGTVFAFAGTVHEIDTSLLLTETLAAGKTLVLPRCAEGHALDLCVVTSMDELVPGMYGILEPKADCALVTPADIDFAVVPCLSFDRRGRRLGQGGGYYDRYLEQYPGALGFLGIRNEEYGSGAAHHNENFDVDESVLPLGVCAELAFLFQ